MTCYILHRVYRYTVTHTLWTFQPFQPFSTFFNPFQHLSPSFLSLSFFAQVSGFTIVAEKLNWLRYVSHFRSVHRGAFFTTMKTTAVRKLLPEGWGFMCLVHTPDGSPCGMFLINFHPPLYIYMYIYICYPFYDYCYCYLRM